MLFGTFASCWLNLSLWKNGTNVWQCYAIQHTYFSKHFTEMNSSWSELFISGLKSGVRHASLENEVPKVEIACLFDRFVSCILTTLFTKKWQQYVTMLCYQNWIVCQIIHSSEQLMIWAFHFRSQKWHTSCQFWERDISAWCSCRHAIYHLCLSRGTCGENNDVSPKHDNFSKTWWFWTAYVLSFPLPVSKVKSDMSSLRTRPAKLGHFQNTTFFQLAR